MFSSRAHLATVGHWSWTVRNLHHKSNRLLHNKETAIFIKQWLPHSAGSYINFRCKSTNGNRDSSLSEVKEIENDQITVAEKVKQTTKDASYFAIIVGGVAVTGAIFYSILSELFSAQSPNAIYTEALTLCQNDTRVIDSIGDSIKGYGELSSRRRRHRISRLEYEKNGINYMRMKFYVEGSRRKGTVHLEVKKDKKQHEYRYLFVDLVGYPQRTIILKDNRHLDENFSKENKNLGDALEKFDA